MLVKKLSEVGDLLETISDFFAILVIIIFHYFFNAIFNRFWFDFGANLEPKSVQNQLKIDPESDLENIQLFPPIFDRILMDFRFVATSF